MATPFNIPFAHPIIPTGGMPNAGALAVINPPISFPPIVAPTTGAVVIPTTYTYPPMPPPMPVYNPYGYDAALWEHLAHTYPRHCLFNGY